MAKPPVVRHAEKAARTRDHFGQRCLRRLGAMTAAEMGKIERRDRPAGPLGAWAGGEAGIDRLDGGAGISRTHIRRRGGRHGGCSLAEALRPGGGRVPPARLRPWQGKGQCKGGHAAMRRARGGGRATAMPCAAGAGASLCSVRADKHSGTRRPRGAPSQPEDQHRHPHEHQREQQRPRPARRHLHLAREGDAEGSGGKDRPQKAGEKGAAAIAGTAAISASAVNRATPNNAKLANPTSPVRVESDTAATDGGASRITTLGAKRGGRGGPASRRSSSSGSTPTHRKAPDPEGHRRQPGEAEAAADRRRQDVADHRDQQGRGQHGRILPPPPAGARTAKRR